MPRNTTQASIDTKRFPFPVTRAVSDWVFGAPVLRTGGVGKAGWLRAEGSVEGLLQKSPSGIIANLYGGVQTGSDNWAAVYVPVNELKTTDFVSAQWTYRFASGEVFGHNMVIWMHDPDDLGNRIEATQAPSGITLDKATGWNDHKLNTGTTQFFYYGEGVSGSGLISGAGNQYTWEEYQADVVFSTWRIYRISIEYGWYSTGTFDESWLTELILNDQVILFQPGPGEIMGREVKSYVLATTDGDDKVLVTPGSGRKIKVISIKMITTSATESLFECYFSVANDMPADKVIATRTLDTDGVTPEEFINYGETGPEGQVGEVVSMKANPNITTNGSFTIVYREI